MDAEGAIWVGAGDTRVSTGRDDSPGGAVVRIREGGEVLQRIEHDRAISGAMLGGPDRKTLFLLAAEWRGVEQVNEAVAARTGQVLVSQGPVWQTVLRSAEHVASLVGCSGHRETGDGGCIGRAFACTGAGDRGRAAADPS